MEFCHAPPGVSRLGVSGLPHPRRGASTLSTCRVASLRRLGPLPPFPGSLVKAPLVNDPYWRDLVLFHEYFHGETGQGLGASHQTDGPLWPSDASQTSPGCEVNRVSEGPVKAVTSVFIVSDRRRAPRHVQRKIDFL